MLHTRLHYVPETDTTIIERIQDCNAIVDFAQAMHNAGNHGSSEMRYAGSYPMVVVEDYCNKRGITFAEFMQNDDHIRALTSDPDLGKLRIWKGRV